MAIVVRGDIGVAAAAGVLILYLLRKGVPEVQLQPLPLEEVMLLDLELQPISITLGSRVL